MGRALSGTEGRTGSGRAVVTGKIAASHDDRVGVFADPLRCLTRGDLRA